MSTVPKVGATTPISAINSSSVSSTISQILKTHGLDNVLLAKIDGRTGNLKIVRLLDKGAPKPLSEAHIKNLPACIEEINIALTKTDVALFPESATLLDSLKNTRPTSLSDTGTFTLDKTSTEIAVSTTPRPNTVITTGMIADYRSRANAIIEKHKLTGALSVDLRRKDLDNGNIKLLFIVTNPTKEVLLSKDSMLGLDRALDEISKTVLSVSYNFIDDTPNESDPLKKMYRLIRNPESKK